MQKTPRLKLLALGLDGGDLHFIRKNLAGLPVLRSILDKAALFEPQPPKALSGSVWPTFYSGCSPGIHGMYQHLVWDANRMGIRRIGPEWCYNRPFWKDLEDRGLSVTVLDVPYAFGGALADGVEITDWATHGQTWPLRCNNPQAGALIRSLGPSPIGRETPVPKSATQLDRIRQDLVTSAGMKGRLITRLLPECDQDIMIAVFAETHRGGHTLFCDDDESDRAGAPTPLLEVYRAVDTALGQVLDAAGTDQTRVLIFSVHGMARNYSQPHLVRPLLDKINEVFIGEHGALQEKRRRPGLIRWLRSRVPAQWQHAIGAAASDRLRQWVVEREIVGGTDWSRTPGFALRTDVRTEIRLNLRSREAKGFLEPGSSEHSRYIDLLTSAFLDLEDTDNGERLVNEVVAIADLYPGPGSERLPDFAITWRRHPPASRVFSPAIGALSVAPNEVRGGDHADRGFALLFGGNPPCGKLPPLNKTEDFAAFIGTLV